MTSNIENSPSTQTINDLVSALSEEERTTYHNILHSINIPIDTFQKYSSWSTESYTRNCIIENDQFELILLCWEKDQATPIHNHGGEECWVKIINGEFEEIIYQEDKETGQLNQIRSSKSSSNDITYMVDFMGFHSLKNISNKRSMSLHLYAKPIRSCRIFNEKTNQFINKKLTYDTVPELSI